MVKRATITKFLPLLAVLLAGCLTVSSREAFYTDEVRTPAPELRGEWCGWQTPSEPARVRFAVPELREDEFGDKQTWLFTGDKTMTASVYAANGHRCFVVVPFKVSGVTFLDIAGGPDHLHTLFAANIQGRTLNVRTLNGDYLTNGISGGPSPMRKGQSILVFTTSSAEWVQFLQHQARNTNSFLFVQSLELLKSPNANFVPARRQQP